MADPLTLLVARLLVAQLAANPPGSLPYAPEGPSIAEIGEAALHCYHPTGRFQSADQVESPWSNADQWQADRSSLIEISWTGALTRQPYTLKVALIGRGLYVRGVFVADNAPTPASRCSLDHWQPAG